MKKTLVNRYKMGQMDDAVKYCSVCLNIFELHHEKTIYIVYNQLRRWNARTDTQFVQYKAWIV